jgi:hypothetical protein
MVRSAAETLQAYLEAQGRSANAALELIADDAVFDVGRGRYDGKAEIALFLERLRTVNSRTSVLDLRDVSTTEAVALFDQRDDDLAPLAIESIQLDVRVETTDDGRIRTFTARPTPESIEALTRARSAGHQSEGLRLAERAGTVPPETTS